MYDAISNSIRPQKSFVIAPNTVRENLVMLYFGATGATKKQLHDAILLSGSQAKISKNFDTPNLINSKRLSFSTSNMFFVSNKCDLSNEFLSLTKRLELKRRYIDFSNPKISAGRINEWVRNSTKQRDIHPLINPQYLDKKSSGILVNLVQFNGVWKHKFESVVVKKKFFTGREEFRRVRMMIQKNTFKYNKIPRLNAEVIELPFDQEMSMMILLPDLVENGIPDLERALSKVDLFELSNQLNYTDMQVEIPQFILTTSSFLKKPLQKVIHFDKIYFPYLSLSNKFLFSILEISWVWSGHLPKKRSSAKCSQLKLIAHQLIFIM